MDYDDNDFQLVGEDNNKFPPNLHPFPLPKFDLDEHLPVHLRFDNIADAEDLLDIQGQGNNWIKDYSPGGSVIEFSSSAAESCSISRHNNVWSEATSSESVEMLLKSVREDDMVAQKDTTKDAEAHDKLNGTDDQTNTFLSQIDSENYKMSDVTDTVPLPPSPDKCLSGLVGGAVRVQPQVECVSQTSNKRLSDMALLPDNSLSGLDGEGVGVQPEVGGTSDISKIEKCRTETEICLSSEKFSEEKAAATDCCVENEVPPSSDNATKNSPIIGESVYEDYQTDNLLHDAFVHKLGEKDCDYIASTSATDDPDSIHQGVLSSVSTCNVDLFCGKVDTGMHSKQVEECREIDTNDKSGLLLHDVQKECSYISDAKITDQTSERFRIASDLGAAHDSSCLELPMNSLMLLKDRCNDHEFSVNPDGMLKGTLLVNASIKECRSTEKIMLPTMERSLMDIDRSYENIHVEISNEECQTTDKIFTLPTTENLQMDVDRNTTENSQMDVDINNESNYVKRSNEEAAQVSYATNNLENVGHGETNQHPEGNSTIEENTHTIENHNMVGSYKERQPDNYVESIEEKQALDVDNVKNNNYVVSIEEKQILDADKDINNVGSVLSREDKQVLEVQVMVHSISDKGAEIVTDVTNIDKNLVFNQSKGSYSNSKPAAIAKHAEDALEQISILDFDVKQNHTSTGSLSSAGTFEVEAPEVTLFTKTISTVNSGQENFDNDASSTASKMEGASSAGQGAVMSSVADSTEVHELIQDDSGTYGVDASEITILSKTISTVKSGQEKFDNDASSPASKMEGASSAGQGAVMSPVADCTEVHELIQDDSGKLVAELSEASKSFRATFTKESTMTSSNSPVTKPTSDNLLVTGKLRGTLSSGEKASLSPSPHMECSSMLIKGESELVPPASVDAPLHSPKNSMLDGASQCPNMLDMDVVEEHKEEMARPYLASDFIHPGKESSEISENAVLPGNLDSHISRDPVRLPDPVVRDDIFAKDFEGVNLVGVDNSDGSHQSEYEDTMAVDAVEGQKKEPASGVPVLDIRHLDDQEMKISGVSSPEVVSDNQLLIKSSIVSDPYEDNPVSTTEHEPTVVGMLSSSVEVSTNDEHNMLLEEDLGSHHTPCKENDDNNSSGAIPRGKTEMIFSHAETASLGESLPSLLHESSSGDCQKKLQQIDNHLTPGEHCHVPIVGTHKEGGTPLHRTNSSPDSSATLSNTQSHMLETESANTTPDQNCGSPTVISCSERSQEETYQEGNRGQQVQKSPALTDLPVCVSESGTKVNEASSTVHGSRKGATAEDDRTFTFEVRKLPDLPENDTSNEWKPFPSMQSSQFCQVSKENIEEHLQSEEGKIPDTVTRTPGEDKKSVEHLEPKESELQLTVNKTSGEDKTSQISCRSTEGLSTPQKDALAEIPPSKQNVERDMDLCSTSPKSTGTISSNVGLEAAERYSYCGSSVKPSDSIPVQKLPDLNSSISAAAFFHQPFTDLQQIQLRAQIFVYGSLIQGIPPDEACMISAFGETDGSRSLWEGLWRVSVESYQNQKSPFTSCETPSHSYSGVQVTKCSSPKSKLPSANSRSVSKVMSSSSLNSAVPVPSPLWSTSTRDTSRPYMPLVTQLDFNQAMSPVHSHQPSQMRQHTGNNSPWLSQTPCPGPWVISSQNATLDTTAPYSKLAVTETVQVTPAKDSSAPGSLNVHFVSPTALLPVSESMNASAASIGLIEAQKKATTVVNSKSATNQKSRKRKKGSAPDELQTHITVSQPIAEPRTVMSKHLLTAPVGLPKLAHSPAKLASSVVVTTTRTVSPTHYQIMGVDNEPRAIFSDETCSKIEQAKLHAEDASALAASAVRHSQGIWRQLATQKETGLLSEADEKLASAAVAAAAAASVAKAAAAAAKVASDAALQAKMMADEAFSSARAEKLTQVSKTGLLDVGKNLGGLTPVSILKGKDKIHGSSTVISAAREAARRRVEAASAATKRAENLDAIVKAAELAAEAVSQAGAIIAMGDPLPFTLNELVESGPEGHWRIGRSANREPAETSSLHREEHMGISCAKDSDRTVDKFKEHQSNSIETGISCDKDRITKSSLQLEGRYPGNGPGDALSTIPIVENEMDHYRNNEKEFGIQEGSLVEVASDDNGRRGVWFSANVLEVKDDKAYVCHNDLLSSEGTGKLKEWISLERDGDKVPKIRNAHPMTTAKYEGIRKRRRAALGNYVWAVGDHVDAWIRDGWREGFITEKSKEDDTKLTVQFPDGGDSSTVPAWDLRPSLVWKDGVWMEWSRPKENVLQSSEGDTPNEKRQKISRLDSTDVPVVGKGVGKMSKNLPLTDPRRPEESRNLILSAKDKVFSAGKGVSESDNSDTHKIRRVGPPKERSRVVIGVPKPGKKRKFMEVSKHYVADKTEKVRDASDSVKFTKYLMPQPSRVWRNTSKMDPKGKSVDDSKSKGLKTVKANIQTRSTTEKENLTTTVSNGAETSSSSLPTARAAFSNEQINFEKKGPEVSTFASTVGKPGTPLSKLLAPTVSSASKKKFSSAVEADVGLKGKLTPAAERSTRREGSYENSEKAVSDAPEPRRSSRRIQPTSRLLEGLQSSLIISKIPSFSHDKPSKTVHRGTSSRGNPHG